MALRRSVLWQVVLPLVPPLVLIHAAEDEREYGALGRSAEAPATEPGFALQPADMEQVNCEIAYLETNEAAALAHRLPASCHSAEPYGRRAADDRDDEEGAASYGDGAAHYASSGAGASSSSAASTPGYTAATGDGYSASAAGQRNDTAGYAAIERTRFWHSTGGHKDGRRRRHSTTCMHRHRPITVWVATRSRRGRHQLR